MNATKPAQVLRHAAVPERARARHSASNAAAAPEVVCPGKPRRSKPRKLIGLAVNLSTVGGLLGFLLLGVGPHTGAYRPITMLTGSMKPVYPVGAILIATPEPIAALEPGQVVTFHAPIDGKPVVTHRVVSVDRSKSQPVIVTKGDANAGTDPWTVTMTGASYWQIRGSIPLLGSAMHTMRTPAVSALLTKAMPVLLLIGVLSVLWRPKRRAH